MSGTTDSQDCPRCNGKGTLLTSSDWKPFDMVSGVCLKCGLRYYTEIEVIENEQDLAEERLCYEYVDDGIEIDKESCEDFDLNYDIKKGSDKE
jgi:hypothetical protein